MSVHLLLADLRARGIDLAVQGDELIVKAPAGAVSDADRQALRTHKPEVLSLLAAASAPPPGPDWSWRTEYIAELGRLVVLIRVAAPAVADRLRELCRMPVPQTCDEWIALGTQWRAAEAELRERGEWPAYPWDDALRTEATDGA